MATSVFVILMSAGLHAAAASQCNIAGVRYRFASDFVDWSMRIEGGQNCSFDFPLNTILSSSPGSVEIENVKLITSPQSGQVIIKNKGFSFTAKTSFQGPDSFTVEVSGAINKVHGISTIHIAVSSIGGVSSLAPHTNLPTPNPLPLGLLTPGASNAPFVSTAAPSSDWSILKIGAGGNLDGMSISSDNTYVVRTDTYGAYLWNPSATAPNGVTGAWQQLVTSSSMPAAFSDISHGAAGNGVYEIQIANSNSSIMYMMYVSTNAYPLPFSIWKTTNKGQTWALTQFTPINNDDGNGGLFDNYRNWGPKIAIDPQTPNTIYVGTPKNGLQYSTDGGSTWNTVSTSNVPASTTDGGGHYPGYLGMVFDNSHNLYVYSYGNGVYELSSGTWAHLTTGTGPTTVQFATVDYSTGYYFAVDTTGDLWRWNGTTWYETISDGTVIAVAADPNLSGHILAAQTYGTLNESFSSGNSASWSGWSSGGPDNGVTLSATNDVLWQPLLNGGIYLQPGWIFFDRNTAKKIYGNGGNNFYVTTPWSGNISTSTDLTWNSQGRGIEQLVANEINVPSANSPVVASWDRAIFQPTLSGAYPSNWYLSRNLLAAWSIDYASTDSSFLVMLADTGAYGLGSFGTCQGSSYSSNGGANWTLFAPPSRAWQTCPGGGNFSGNVAASSHTNAIFAPAGGVQPYYTTNLTSSPPTWTGITLPGSPSWATFIPNAETNTRVVCADRVNANTFYLMLNTIGIYKTTSGGASWTQQNNSTTSWGPNPHMRCVPGEAGYIWIASGSYGYPSSIGDDLNYSTNGGANWTTAPIEQSTDVGFGAAKPGNSNPAVFVIGWYTQSITSQSATIRTGNFNFIVAAGNGLVSGAPVNFNDGSSNELEGHIVSYNNSTGALVINVSGTTGSGTHTSWTVAVYGEWRSDDNGTTWNQIGGWPAGSLDVPKGIVGDPSVYGEAYMGFGGQGYLYLPSSQSRPRSGVERQ